MKKRRVTMRSMVDGLDIDILIVEPEEVKGVVQLVHGMCEHKERYLRFMEYLSSEGFACIIHDHRGHGGSVKDTEHLGYMYGGGANALVEDVHQVTEYAKHLWENRKITLLGHSMGSLVVRAYMKNYDYEVNKLIVVGSPSRKPALGIGKCVVKFQEIVYGRTHCCELIKHLSFGLYAKRFVCEKNKFAWCCSDPVVQEAYATSELCGFTFTVDAYEALFELMHETYSLKGWACSRPKMPIVFLSGAQDACYGNVRKFKEAINCMRMVGYKRVKGKLYPGLRHEILFEIEKEQVYKDILRILHL